jgi:hypothetical protein
VELEEKKKVQKLGGRLNKRGEEEKKEEQHQSP